MKDYVVEEEEQLSPIVVAMTAILILALGVGILYRLVGVLV